MKIALFAGSRQEVDKYIVDNKLTPSDVAYIYSEALLMPPDFKASRIEVIGTFYERKDAHSLLKFARQMLGV